MEKAGNIPEKCGPCPAWKKRVISRKNRLPSGMREGFYPSRNLSKGPVLELGQGTCPCPVLFASYIWIPVTLFMKQEFLQRTEKTHQKWTLKTEGIRETHCTHKTDGIRRGTRILQVWKQNKCAETARIQITENESDTRIQVDDYQCFRRDQREQHWMKRC